MQSLTSTLVVFELERIRDRATNLYSHHYLEGIGYVFVNGVLVVDGEQHTGALSGQVLRHRIKTSEVSETSEV
jgi:N-acyl-D-amino-acid deacylase